ncbi:protein amalgam [Eurytemora carolleeae]|uniref:protein amalgam n=1 Tax=Eurytemora carolleeae TaxID=1294199 RepID=UPI000C7933C4|nr:protein amalgam [Eurytemora carolleeae]|eukprot:XP_023342473.1 protein amalgam-like [Eurytemora affinis]
MLSNLTVEDAGQYTCEVETDIENPLILTHQLDILVPPTIEELNAPGELQVMKGSSITLKCRAKGFPVPKIEWSRSTGSIPLELFSYDRSFLTITNLTRQDGGEYACTAENGVGFPDRHVIRINVKHSPEVIPVTQVVYTGIGEPVELSCTVYASPTGSMTWYHNSMVLDHDNNTFFRSKGSVHTLFISEVKLETLGNYTCLASNVYGRGETTIQLTGIPEPPKYCPELSGEWNNGIYLLAWTCSSATAVIKYRLQYRRFQGKHSVSQEPWFKIEISEESQDTSLYSMQYSLEHLSAWVTYEATIEAYNKFGWSYPSQPFNFTPNSGGVSKPAVISTQPKTQSMTSFGTQVSPFAVIIHAILLVILVLNR